MKKFLGLFLSAFLLMFALVGCSEEEVKEPVASEEETEQVEAGQGYPRTFIDGRGVEVTLEQEPTRIVSTALAIDEYLLSLVDTDRIAAVTQISTDAGISNVAGLTDEIKTKIETVTAEQIISLNPDLVIVPTYVNPEVLDQLDKSGLTVYQVKDDASFAGVLSAVEEIGALVGAEDRAAEVVADVKARMAKLEENAAKQEEKKRVLYWTQYGGTVTSNTTIGEMIELAGGINVVDEAGITGDDSPDYPALSKEKLIELNPDVIITEAWMYDGSEATFLEEWKNDSALQTLDAFKNDQVHVIDSANLTTAAHYVIEGAEDIYNVLYGE